MKETDIETWKKKLDWIAQSGGMVHLKTHPDYMCFDTNSQSIEEYPVEYYADFLRYVRQAYSGRYWHTSPAEVADFYFRNSDENAWTQINGDLLCPTCRSSFKNKKLLVYGVSGNGDISR